MLCTVQAVTALVMRRSLDGDEDQGAEVPTVVHDPGRRARYVPDRRVSAGASRSLPDGLIYRLTCIKAG
jgi:hypothetical protein